MINKQDIVNFLELNESSNLSLIVYVKNNEIEHVLDVDQSNIHRTVGPEYNILNFEPKAVFESRVAEASKRLYTINILPLLCEFDGTKYWLLDSNHLFEALKRSGQNNFSVVVVKANTVSNNIRKA